MFIPFGTREAERKTRFPYVTAALVAINVAIFVYQIYLAVTYGEAQLAGFLNGFAVTPADVTDGTPLEAGLLTSMFLHGGLLHIVFNMLYLMPFGDNVEDRMGHGRYLLFYVACGLAASLVHIAFNPESTVPLIGASGAIAGVLAGYLVLYPRGYVRGLFFLWIIITRIELPAMAFILFWFAMQVFNSYVSLGVDTSEGGGVAFLAHVGGFIAGFVLAPIFGALSRRPDVST